MKANVRLLILGTVLVVSGSVAFLFFAWKPAHYTSRAGDSTPRIWLEKKATDLYYIHTYSCLHGEEEQSNVWRLAYPVYQFECGDVNGDGKAEILAGVVKTTRFDPVMRKRLFIFKLVDGYIRPLWLGSRVGQPLEDFHLKVTSGKGIIRTVELEADGRYLVAEYEWRSFGLKFRRYLQREVSLPQATTLLTQ